MDEEAEKTAEASESSKESKKSPRNPFQYTAPLSGKQSHTLLIGRERHIKDIGYILDQLELDAPSKNIAIIGERASGKTSLLNRIFEDAKDRTHFSVKVTLTSRDVQSETSFWKKVYETFFQEATDQEIHPENPKFQEVHRRALDGEELSEDLESYLEFESALQLGKGRLNDIGIKNDIQEFIRATSKCLVLLIDEGQHLEDKQSILEQIRILLEGMSGFMLILSGSEEFLTTLKDTHDGLARTMDSVRLNFFDDEYEIQELIEEFFDSIDGYEYKNSGEDKKLLTGWDWTKNNKDEWATPNLLKFCREMYETAGGEPHKILHMSNIAFELFHRGEIQSFDLTTEVYEKWINQIQPEAKPFIKRVEKTTKQDRDFLNKIGGGLGHSIETVCDVAYLGFSLDREETKSRIFDLESKGLIEIDEDLTIRLTGGSVERQYLRVYSRTRKEAILPPVYQRAEESISAALNRRLREIDKTTFGRTGPKFKYQEEEHDFAIKVLEGVSLAASVDNASANTNALSNYSSEQVAAVLHLLSMVVLRYRRREWKEAVIRTVFVSFPYAGSTYRGVHFIDPDVDLPDFENTIILKITRDMEFITGESPTIKVFDTSYYELFKYILTIGILDSTYLAESHQDYPVLHPMCMDLGFMGTDFYIDGEDADAKLFLTEAYKLTEILGPHPVWKHEGLKNNFSYLKMKDGKYFEASEILKNLQGRESAPLEQYNYVIALIGAGQLEEAGKELEIFRNTDDSLYASVIFLPDFDGSDLKLNEVSYEAEIHSKEELLTILKDIIEALRNE